MAANRVYPIPTPPNYGQQQLPHNSVPNGLRYTYPSGSSPSVFSTSAPAPMYTANQAQMRPPPMPYYPQGPYTPPMARPSSAALQGTFSTYPSRIKRSDNNALLLPMSYMGTRKAKFTGQSDDEFDDYDDEDTGTPSSGTRTRSQAQQQQAGSQSMAPTGSGGTPVNAAFDKIPRKRNNVHTSEEELTRGSDIDEVLVPIRLDLDLDEIKLRDVFLWNMNGKSFGNPGRGEELSTKDLLSIIAVCRAILDSREIW
jgi:hypothetical protein